MPGTLAFAPTPEDLDDDLFTVPVLTFAPPKSDDEPEEEEG
jgi:hypothetical protein